jgi:NAD(P)-dependent dehydrogenase (short-subunit alcohol dehydrogenase family)
MSDLKGKAVIVTAGAKGIGQAIVRRFAAEGARIVFCDIDEEAADALCDEIGPAVRFIKADCSRITEVRAFVDAAIAALGGVDVLINNAGIAISKTILDLTDDEFDQTIAVNLKAAFAATQIVARRMIADGVKGAIVNMSSVNAVMAIPHILAYNISKGGLNQLTRNTAIVLAEHGIRVNAIGPGTILTDLVRQSIFTSDAARRTTMARTPLRRAGEPEEIASVAVFLATAESSYITGQILYADGGRMALNYTVPVDD